MASFTLELISLETIVLCGNVTVNLSKSVSQPLLKASKVRENIKNLKLD